MTEERSHVRGNDDGKSEKLSNGGVVRAAPEQKVALKKELDFWGGVAMVVGLMIGSGIFVSPKGVLRGAGSVGLSLIVWLLGGFVSMMGAISYVELGTMITKSGGEYAYLREAFHPVFGYLFAYISTVLLKPASSAIISMACGEYLLSTFFQDGCGKAPDIVAKFIALATMLSLAALNSYSVRAATKVQVVFTAAKLVTLAVIIGGGVYNLVTGHTGHLADSFTWVDQPATLGSVALGFYSSMWAYDGWNNLNYCTEELQEPLKNLPRAIFVGIPLVTIVYVLTIVSYHTVLSPQELLASSAVAVSWAEYVIPSFAWIIPLSVAMSTFGAGNGSLFTAGRLVFVAAREGHMIESLSYVHAKRYTPAPAIMFTILIALFMMIPSNIESLIDFFSIVAWLFYAMVFGGLLWLRIRRPRAIRPFTVRAAFLFGSMGWNWDWDVPLVCPVLALIVSTYLVLAPIIDDPKMEYIYAIAFVLSGLVFYVPFVHFKWELSGMKCFNIFWQLFLEVAPPPEFQDELNEAWEEVTEVKDSEDSRTDITIVKQKDPTVTSSKRRVIISTNIEGEMYTKTTKL